MGSGCHSDAGTYGATKKGSASLGGVQDLGLGVAGSGVLSTNSFCGAEEREHLWMEKLDGVGLTWFLIRL